VGAYLQATGRLPVNVKFIIEGEEESGGQSLAAFIPENKQKLAADIAVVSDTAIISPEQPAIVYGLRGNSYVLLDISGPARDLHSGSYGGAINNPLNVLGHVIAALKDMDGTVQIPGFYDNVRPLSAEERELLNALPLTEAQLLADTGAPAVWGEPAFTLVERLSARPTLDVHGISGGYTGPGAKTVLPARVHAKISMRLVPDQDPVRIAAAFRAYVESLVPASCRLEMTFRGGGGSPATIVDYRVPAVQAARRAYAAAFGREPLLMREGGSIPVVGQFQKHLDLQTVLMGFGLPTDRLHSPNERFYLPNFYRGIETALHFLAHYAELSQRP
jgi:acetylornithine deacetylase/succinyl-diaminopimelate desuccinylase-like protein